MFCMVACFSLWHHTPGELLLHCTALQGGVGGNAWYRGLGLKHRPLDAKEHRAYVVFALLLAACHI
jgi:hypothetical protein